MTDRELLELALEDLEWAKMIIKIDGSDIHEFLDDTIATITKRLETKDD